MFINTMTVGKKNHQYHQQQLIFVHQLSSISTIQMVIDDNNDQNMLQELEIQNKQKQT